MQAINASTADIIYVIDTTMNNVIDYRRNTL